MPQYEVATATWEHKNSAEERKIHYNIDKEFKNIMFTILSNMFYLVEPTIYRIDCQTLIIVLKIERTSKNV